MIHRGSHRTDGRCRRGNRARRGRVSQRFPAAHAASQLGFDQFGIWPDDRCLVCRRVAPKKQAVKLDRKNGELRCTGRSGAPRKKVGVLLQVRGRRSNGVEPGPVSRGGEVELPASRLSFNQSPVAAVDCEPGSGKAPAVVGAAGSGAVRVDRARVVDQHRAMTALVVSEQDVAVGEPRRREPEFLGNTGERVGLVGFDVDELRRGSARGAASARHVGRVFATDRALHLGHPRREVASGQVSSVARVFVGHRCAPPPSQEVRAHRIRVAEVRSQLRPEAWRCRSFQAPYLALRRRPVLVRTA